MEIAPFACRFVRDRQSARWDKEASDIKKNKTAKINIIQIA